MPVFRSFLTVVTVEQPTTRTTKKNSKPSLFINPSFWIKILWIWDEVRNRSHPCSSVYISPIGASEVVVATNAGCGHRLRIQYDRAPRYSCASCHYDEKNYCHVFHNPSLRLLIDFQSLVIQRFLCREYHHLCQFVNPLPHRKNSSGIMCP